MTMTLTYIDALRAELSDLPATEREELLEDITTSLDESGKDDAAIAARLGPPARFAQELRSAAGLQTPAPAPPLPGPSTLDRLGAGARRAAPLARELAPIGWLIRGYIAAVAIGFTVGAEWYLDRPGVFTVRANVWNAFWLCVVCIAISVVVGVAMRRGGRRTGAMIAVNALFAIGAVPVALAVLDQVGERTNAAFEASPSPDVPVANLVFRGLPVENIYAYARDGRPLRDVRLYDQNGAPLSIGGPDSPDPNRRVTSNADGRRVFNAFPIRYFEPGTTRIADPDAGFARRKPPLLRDGRR